LCRVSSTCQGVVRHSAPKRQLTERFQFADATYRKSMSKERALGSVLSAAGSSERAAVRSLVPRCPVPQNSVLYDPLPMGISIYRTEAARRRGCRRPLAGPTTSMHGSEDGVAPGAKAPRRVLHGRPRGGIDLSSSEVLEIIATKSRLAVAVRERRAPLRRATRRASCTGSTISTS
jgi:hypothetical protein